MSQQKVWTLYQVKSLYYKWSEEDLNWINSESK